MIGESLCQQGGGEGCGEGADSCIAEGVVAKVYALKIRR